MEQETVLHLCGHVAVTFVHRNPGMKAPHGDSTDDRLVAISRLMEVKQTTNSALLLIDIGILRDNLAILGTFFSYFHVEPG